jgi:gamma-glutamyltranspeptidase / glutathione hydrolase
MALRACAAIGGFVCLQWALNAFVHHVDRKMNLQEAIDAPAWHTDHLISSFYPRQFRERSLSLEARVQFIHDR